MLTLIGSAETPTPPENDTAWLIRNMRKGGAIVTRNGIRTREFLPTTYTDPDTGRQSHPLYPADKQGGRVYTDTSTKPMLD